MLHSQTSQRGNTSPRLQLWRRKVKRDREKRRKYHRVPTESPQSPQTQSVEAPLLLMTLCETPQETPVFRCVVVALGGCAQHLAGGGPSEWVQILSVTNCLLLSPVTVIKRTQSAHVTTTVAQSLSFCYVMIAYLCILFIDLKKIQKHSSHYETIVIEFHYSTLADNHTRQQHGR